MEKSLIQQRLHQQRNATGFKHVFRDIFAARFQIRDIGRPLENLGNVKQIKLDAAFVGDGRQMQGCIG